MAPPRAPRNYSWHSPLALAVLTLLPFGSVLGPLITHLLSSLCLSLSVCLTVSLPHLFLHALPRYAIFYSSYNLFSSPFTRCPSFTSLISFISNTFPICPSHLYFFSFFIFLSSFLYIDPIFLSAHPSSSSSSAFHLQPHSLPIYF